MRRTMSVVILLLLLLVLVACGRRLPTEEERAAASANTTAETTTETTDDSTAADEGITEATLDDATLAEMEASNAVGSVSTSTALQLVSPENMSDEMLVQLAGLGRIENGQMLFEALHPETGFACSTCHEVDTSESAAAGGGFAGLPYIAANRVEDYTAERYLYASIIAPSAHLVPDYPDNLMPQNYVDIYSASEIIDLVAYMLTLEDESMVGTEVEPAIINVEEPPVELASAEDVVEDPTPDAPAETEPTEVPADDTDAGEAVVAEPPPAEDAPEDNINLLVSIASASNGETLFNQMVNDAGFACSNCHAVDSTQTLVGPGLLGVPARAADHVAGESAERYLYNSIVNSNAYIVDGFNAGLMPAVYGDVFTDAQVYDLVAYLMTLSE